MTLGIERENIFFFKVPSTIYSEMGFLCVDQKQIVCNNTICSHVTQNKERERSQRNHFCQQNYNGQSKQCYTCSCCVITQVANRNEFFLQKQQKNGQITMGLLLSSTNHILLKKGKRDACLFFFFFFLIPGKKSETMLWETTDFSSPLHFCLAMVKSHRPKCHKIICLTFFCLFKIHLLFLFQIFGVSIRRRPK